MATIYASDGDTVVIARRQYTVTMHDTGPMLHDTTPPPRCQACGQNDAYGEPTDAALLCPGCAEVGQTDMIVRYIIDNADDVYPVLDRIRAAMDDLDRQGRDTGVAYVDNMSAAWDALDGCDDDAIRNALWRTYGVAMRYMRDHPAARHP